MNLENYYDVPALNNSLIKSLNSMKLDEKDKSWNVAFDRGTVLDFMLTEDISTFEDKFKIVTDVPIYSKGSNAYLLFEAVKAQITDVCNPVYNLKLAHEQAEIKESYETTMKKFDARIIDFWVERCCAEKSGVNVIRREEYEIGMKCVADLKSCEVPQIKRMFHPIEGFEATGQEEIYCYYLDCPCKIKIDIKLIDHVNKTIQLIDIKTTGNWTSNFAESFKQFGYNYQAEFYHFIYRRSAEYQKYKEMGYVLSPTFDFCVVSTLPNGGLPLYYCYEVGNQQVMDNIFKAMDIYKLCTAHGRNVNKQSYYELQVKLGNPLKLEA